jgi:hypothetical protein
MSRSLFSLTNSSGGAKSSSSDVGVNDSWTVTDVQENGNGWKAKCLGWSR